LKEKYGLRNGGTGMARGWGLKEKDNWLRKAQPLVIISPYPLPRK
jgi:hypothetical protein